MIVSDRRALPPPPCHLLLPLLAALGCSDGGPVDGGPPGGNGHGDGQVDTGWLTPLCQVSVECGGSILDNPKAPCSMTIADAGGDLVYDGDAGFELRGRSSLSFPKPQYLLELRDHTELPIWPGGTWRYLDDGTDPGPGWTDPGFDDAGWSEGSAPLGYGTDYLQTTIADGSITTWFRKDFTLGRRDEVTRLEFGLKRDDGVAVYLNGTEVYRDNLPAAASSQTPAVSTSSDEDSLRWWSIDLDDSLLVDGENLVAVEVHQASDDLQDHRFDLYLEATGEDRPTSLLGMGSEDDWILNGQYVDRVLFRNRLAYDLYQSFGSPRYATDTQFCELQLNGEYQGIYTLGERLERDDDRVDIGPGQTPGDSFIVKNSDDWADGFHPSSVSYGTWELVYPDPDPAAEAAVSQVLSAWEDAILGADPADPVSGIFAYVDLDAAVDWVILQELFKNADAYLLSVHLWKDEGADSKMFFAPWDLDLSLGSYPYDDCGPEGWVDRDFWVDGQNYDIPFIQRMAEVPEFRAALSARWAELRQDVLSEENILQLIEAYDAVLEPALGENLDRWPIEEIAFSTDSNPQWLCPVGSYEEEHERVVTFLQDRLLWMDANIGQF